MKQLTPALKHPIRKTVLATIIASFCTHSFAQPFFTNDPRAIAMGGAGVSGSSTLGSPEYNPALLTTFDEEDDFGFALGVGTFIMDPRGLADGVETFTEDSLIDNFNKINDTLIPDIQEIVDGDGQTAGLIDITNSLTSSFTNFSSTLASDLNNLGDISGGFSPNDGSIEDYCSDTANDGDISCILQSIDNDSSALDANFQKAQQSLSDIQEIVDDLKEGLDNINNKPLEAYATLSPRIIFPSKRIGVAFNLGTENMIGVKVVLNDQDLSLIDDAINDASGILGKAQTVNGYIGGNEEQSIIGLTDSGKVLINLTNNVQNVVDFLGGNTTLTAEQYANQGNRQVLQCPLDPACANYVSSDNMGDSIQYFADFATSTNPLTTCIESKSEYDSNLGTLTSLGDATINGDPLVAISTTSAQVPLCNTDGSGNPIANDPDFSNLVTVDVPDAAPVVNSEFDLNEPNTYPIEEDFSTDFETAVTDLENGVDQLESDCTDTVVTAMDDVLCYEGNFIAPNEEGNLAVKDDALNAEALTSYVEIVGVTINEFGVSLAKQFDIKGQTISFGIKPKIQMLGVAHKRILLGEADDLSIDSDELIQDDTTLKLTANIDFGVAKEFDYYGKVKLGFVIKNLIPQTFDSPIDDSDLKFKISPQARIGISHHTKYSTVAMDLDLTNNESIAPGFGTPTRMFSIGVEGDLFGWAQLRLGYRANLSSLDSENSYLSMGAGFAPFGVVGIDIATWINTAAIAPAFDLSSSGVNSDLESNDQSILDDAKDVTTALIKDIGIMGQFRVTF
jgi:hypothetical protein